MDLMRFVKRMERLLGQFPLGMPVRVFCWHSDECVAKGAVGAISFCVCEPIVWVEPADLFVQRLNARYRN